MPSSEGYVAGAPPPYSSSSMYPAPPSYVPDAPPMEAYHSDIHKQGPIALGAAAQPPVPPPQPVPVGQAKGGSSSGGWTNTIVNIANDIGRGIDSVARAVQGATGADLLPYLKTGAVIQLGNPKTRSTLEVVVSPQTSYLMVDCRGPVDQNALHAQWTVFRESNTSIVRLHNRDNFLGVVNGEIGLVKVASPKDAPMNTRFRVRQAGGQLCLESLFKPAHYIVVESNDLSVKLKEVFTFTSNSYFLLYVVPQRK
jgi:hypothetical protein